MTFEPAKNLNQVIFQIDTIINSCVKNGSTLGYFAILYKEVTIGVQTAINQGFFEDGYRMEKLDVVFANRYLLAYHQYSEGQKPSSSWLKTFDCMKNADITVMQHLLLGMNAHINLDLGIAAAEICNSDNIEALHGDFQKINTVITNIYHTILPRLKKISWPIVMLGDISPSLTNKVINFSIEKARNQAWANALLLCEAGKPNLEQVIDATDSVITYVAEGITQPGRLVKIALSVIKLFESNDIAKNLVLLKG